MTTWEQILALPEEYRQRVFALYNSNPILSFTIRRCLAGWIEMQNWSFYTDSSAATYDEAFFQQCYRLLQQFIEQLEVLLFINDNTDAAFPITTCLNSLKQSLDTGNFEIIRYVDDALRAEMEIIKQYQNSLLTLRANDLLADPINLEALCLLIHQKLLHTSNLLLKLEQYQMQSRLYELNTLYTNDVLVRHHEVIGQLEAATRVIIADLTAWTANRKSPNTYNSFSELFDGTKQCQSLASSLMLLWRQLKKVEVLQVENQAGTMKVKIATTLKSLLQASFLIEQQPYQVIKTNLKLKRIIITCLVGNLFSGQTTTSLPVVKANLINEHQARQLLSVDDLQYFTGSDTTASGEIVHNSAILAPKTSTSNVLYAAFSQMQVKKVRRRTVEKKKRRPSESVMDEKLAFLFSCEFVLDEELRIGVKVLSEPVVVIVNTHQEAHAQATILWDGAFAEQNRSPFDVPQEVPFSRLARILSQKFLEHACRLLSEESLNYLAEKLQLPGHHHQNLVSFSTFAREHLPSTCFTFWEWFNATLKLTNDHLRDLWYEGTIIGFISRAQAEELLLDQPIGTFLLRFSDSRLGAICITVVTAERTVLMVEPFSGTDLKIRSLADRLRDFDQLVWLYPGLVPKEEAFGRFYSSGNGGPGSMCSAREGYVFPVQLNFIGSG